MNAIKIVILFIAITATVSCGDSKPDNTPNYENNSYNAYFIYPIGNEKKAYVGTVKGLSSCKYVVSTYYSKRRKFVEGDWDYVCCLRIEGNECAEEHRYEK